MQPSVSKRYSVCFCIFLCVSEHAFGLLYLCVCVGFCICVWVFVLYAGVNCMYVGVCVHFVCLMHEISSV